MPPQSIGQRYSLKDPISVSEMGKIHPASDTFLNRDVVIKLVQISSNLPTNNLDRQKALKNFEREAHILGSLGGQHHIVPLYDYGTEMQGANTLAYMVMPYYKEKSLDTWWRNYRTAKPLLVKEVVEILEQAGDAVQFAHDRDIIHRDIKLENFLVQEIQNSSDLPNLLLADFGIARPTQGTTTQNGPGTRRYMAPEQWNQTAVKATDQYALAVMAYYLLTGTYPFDGNQFQLMYAHNNVQPDRPSVRNCPNIPQAVDEAILRALAKRPEERYPTVKDFIDAFRDASKPIETPREEPKPFVAKSRGHLGLWKWTLLFMVLILILSLSLNAFFVYKNNTKTNLPSGPQQKNIIKTCQSGPDSFQIQKFSNKQLSDLEYIGMSDDTTCYTFTTEDSTQPADIAETTIYKNNQQIPTNKPHITIIVASMLSHFDNSSYSTGLSLLQGAAIAQQEYNEHRSTNQLPLRLIIANSGTNESFAGQLAQEIAELPKRDHSIIGVVGWPYSTNQAKEALATLDQAQISSVSPTLSSTQFDGISPYFFRIIPSDVTQGDIGTTFLLKHSIKYVIIGEDPKNPYSVSLAETVSESFKTQSGGPTPLVVSYERGTLNPSGTTKLSAFETSVNQDISYDETSLKAQPKQIAIYFAGYASDFAYFRGYLNNTYPQVLVIGGDGLDESTAYASLDTSNFYFTTFADYQLWPKSSKQPCFINQYDAFFNPHGQNGSDSILIEDDAVLGYDATDTLLEAYINIHEPASSVPSLESMQRQLTNVNFLGVSGPIALSPDGNASGKAVYIDYYDVKNGPILQKDPSSPPPSTQQGFPFCQ